MKRYILSANEIAEKSVSYNNRQLAVGAPLKTLKGSVIKRSAKYGVGKEIGGKIYAHRDYIEDIVPTSVLANCLDLLRSAHPDFKWNCFRYDPVTQEILFQEAPDFDTAREPVVGNAVFVNPKEGSVSRERHYPQIWHHKWLWVKNDYSGFDVEDSWNWSKKWLSILEEPADGSNQGNWVAQLSRYHIE